MATPGVRLRSPEGGRRAPGWVGRRVFVPAAIGAWAVLLTACGGGGAGEEPERDWKDGAVPAAAVEADQVETPVSGSRPGQVPPGSGGSGSGVQAEGEPETSMAEPAGSGSGTPVVADGIEEGEPDPTAPVFQRPESVRGIYLNAWASGSTVRTDAFIEMARRTEINTFVIDVKDATGYISYPTEVALAREIGADREIRIRNVRRLLERLHEEGIYPIARIVVFKDHLLAETRPDMAIRDSTGAAWVDGRGDVWVNPYDERVWAYHAEVAREAVELGFPEVQWDYIRFPDRPSSELELAVFPGQADRTRSRAIRDFLVWTRSELADLEVSLTADVFGVATSASHDVGIGQLWEDFIDVVDAALPMVYPSHYWVGSFGIDEPNAHPYEVVAAALRDAVRRTDAVEGGGRIIPWLQDFTLGPPRYEAAEVRAQIQATYDAGIQEWILWNASGRYTEEALEPAGGWGEGVEPLIRFGGEVVPVSRRLLDENAPEVPPDRPLRPSSPGC